MPRIRLKKKSQLAKKVILYESSDSNSSLDNNEPLPTASTSHEPRVQVQLDSEINPPPMPLTENTNSQKGNPIMNKNWNAEMKNELSSLETEPLMPIPDPQATASEKKILSTTADVEQDDPQIINTPQKATVPMPSPQTDTVPLPSPQTDTVPMPSTQTDTVPMPSPQNDTVPMPPPQTAHASAQEGKHLNHK